MKQLKDIEIVLFDMDRILQTGEYNFRSSFMNLLVELKNNTKKDKNIICIIIGVDKFVNEIETSPKSFMDVLKRAEELKNYSFVLVENFSKLKNHGYDDWYKEYITGDSGIWVGNGIGDQYVIEINVRDPNIVNNCGESFGYVIKREQVTAIKLLGMKEDGEENE